MNGSPCPCRGCRAAYQAGVEDGKETTIESILEAVETMDGLGSSGDYTKVVTRVDVLELLEGMK